jgi:signal transduction histidine kinase
MMRTPPSLSLRLLAGAAVWVTLALVAAGVVLTAIFRDHLQDQFARRMEATLDQLAANLDTGAEGAVALTSPLSQPRFDQPYSGLYWQVEAADGAVLLRSRSLWDHALDLPPDTLLDGDLHHHRLAGPRERDVRVYERSVRLPGRDGRLRLAVGEDAAALGAAVADFRRPLIASLAVLGLGLMLAAGLQVMGGLRPLRRLRRALSDVRAGRAERVAGTYPPEIAPVVADLNAVLETNGQIVARARTQAGNLAHGLKTPLAVLSNQAAALDTAGRQDDAQRLTEQIRLMQRHVDYHLARARAAAATRVPGTRTEVAARIAKLARTMRTIHGNRGIDVSADVPPDAVVKVEQQDLDEMLGNLLDNACKHANEQVHVSMADAGGAWRTIRIDDDGPGLPPDRRAAVFDRGTRLDETAGGAGLGLTIVAELTALYGGEARLLDAPSGGLRAEVRLPADAPATDERGQIKP